MSDTSISPEELLARSDFVRAIARRLVADPHAADDLAQEAFVAAIERPPRGAVASWLRRVVVNAFRKDLRTAARRRAREAVAGSRGLRVPSASEILERETLRREVVDAVLALPEPHRSTLILRYYEERPPREIAAHFGVPVETVRTRARRALALLRRRLEPREGRERDRWRAGLVLLAGPTGSGVAARGVAAAALLVAAGLALLLLFGGETAPEPRPAAPRAPEVVLVADVPPPALEAPVPLPAESAPEPGADIVDLVAPPAPEPEPEPEPKAVETPVEVLVRGITVDAAGEPLPGVAVTVRTEGLPAGYEFFRREVRSDTRGRFEATVVAGLTYAFEAEKPGYGAIPGPPVEVGEDGVDPVRIVLSSDTSVRVRVVDPAGRPIEGALVNVTQVNEQEGSHRIAMREERTDAEGRVRFADLAVGWTMEGHVLLAGRGLEVIPRFEVRPGSPEIRVVLHPERKLTLRVVDAATGKPVPDVDLYGGSGNDPRRRGFGLTLTPDERRLHRDHRLVKAIRTGPDRWRIEGASAAEPWIIYASAKGWFRGRLDLEAWEEGEREIRLERTGDVDLVVRVTDSRGRPADSALVHAFPVTNLPRGKRHYPADFARKGRVVLRGLQSGVRYFIDAWGGGSNTEISRPFLLTAGDSEEIAIRLEKTGGIRFRLESGEPRQPLRDPYLVIQEARLADGQPLVVLRGRSHSLQGGRHDRLLPGVYTLSFIHTGFVTATVRGVTVEAGKYADVGRVVLPPAGRIEVRLPAVPDAPGFWARPVAVHEDGWVEMGGLPKGSATATIRTVRPGANAVVLEVSGKPPVLLADVTVVAGETVTIDADPPEPGAIGIAGAPPGAKIDITADRPAPLDRYLVTGLAADSTLWFRTPEPPERFWAEPDFRADAAGRLGPVSLAPGRYLVEVGGRRQAVVVESGATALVEARDD